MDKLIYNYESLKYSFVVFSANQTFSKREKNQLKLNLAISFPQGLAKLTFTLTQKAPGRHQSSLVFVISTKSLKRVFGQKSKSSSVPSKHAGTADVVFYNGL